MPKNWLCALLIFVQAGLISQALHAAEPSSGYLIYRYIGDSTGVPNQYLFEFAGFMPTAEADSAPLLTKTMHIQSLCAPPDSLGLQLALAPASQRLPGLNGARPIYSQLRCSGQGLTWIKYLYRGTAVLAPCPHYRFSLNTVGSVVYDNVEHRSQVLFEATLNNTISQKARYFSLPKPDLGQFTGDFWSDERYEMGRIIPQAKHQLIEFQLSPSYEGPADSVGRALPFKPGYLAAKPLKGPYFELEVSASDGGLIRFHAQDSGRFKAALSLRVINFDTVTPIFYQTGSFRLEYEIILNGPHRPEPAPGPQVFLPQGRQQESLPCGSLKINLVSDQPLRPASLSADGSQFRLQSRPYQQAIPVMAARLVDPYRIELSLNAPLQREDELQLTFKEALDGRWLQNLCRYPQIVKDSLLIKLRDCPEQLGASELFSADWSLYPNPAHEQLHLQGSELEGIERIEIIAPSGRVEKLWPSTGQRIYRADRALKLKQKAGLYLVRIQHREGLFHRQILILP